MARQGTLKGVVPPMNIAQEAALLYIEAEDEKKRMAERAADRKEDMINAAARLGIDVVKIRDAHNKLHIFDFTNKITVKHNTLTDVKIEKLDKEAVTA